MIRAISRRQFLATLIFSGGILGAVKACLASIAESPIDNLRNVIKRVPMSAPVRDLGKSYLSKSKTNVSIEALENRLAPLFRHEPGFGDSFPLFAKQLADDFEAGRLFEWRGWSLADTEAALVALAHLTRK